MNVVKVICEDRMNDHADKPQCAIRCIKKDSNGDYVFVDSTAYPE